MPSIIFKSLGFVVFIFLLQRIIYSITGFGFHKTVFDHSPGPCRILPVIEYGSEDLTILPNGIAIVSAGLYGHPYSNLYTIDMKESEKNVREVQIVGLKKSELYPHGLSTWIDHKSGKVTIFLVNHSPNAEAVILFEFNEEENTLYYKKTITDPLFKSLNDLVATGRDTFYATNFLTFGYKYVVLEKVLRLSFSTVVYYNGKEASVVASGLSGPNGINISPDKKFLYVATSFSEQLFVYKRNEDSSLEQVKVVNIYTSADNIEVDPSTGALWLGCHPIGHKLMAKERIKGASQVLQIEFDNHWNSTVKEIYADNGNNFKGSSVASIYGNQMLVGSITGYLLHCDVKAF